MSVRLEDLYCSLVFLDDIKANMDFYIDNVISKRNRKEEFDIIKRMEITTFIIQ